MNMNFSEKIKENSQKHEVARETFENWKKPLSIEDVSTAIREIYREMADETGDPIAILEDLMVALKLVEKLFPKEEFEEYLKEKGEE